MEVEPEVVGSVFYQKYHEAMREQKTVHFEAYSPFNDRWDEVYAYPSEEGLSVYTHDITQRKRAEEQLAYHAYVLEHVHDAVIATDEQLLVTAWNKGAERMYGWRANEILGRNLWEAVPVDLRAEQRAEALRELSQGVSSVPKRSRMPRTAPLCMSRGSPSPCEEVRRGRVR